MFGLIFYDLSACVRSEILLAVSLRKQPRLIDSLRIQTKSHTR